MLGTVPAAQLRGRGPLLIRAAYLSKKIAISPTMSLLPWTGSRELALCL